MVIIVSPQPKRTSEMLDRLGNIINPVTKEIIKPKEKEESILPPIESQPPVQSPEKI